MPEAQRLDGIDRRPILVFGMARSGTTWIGKLFDSHPHTLYRHEPDTAQRLGISRFPDRTDAAEHADELAAFIANLPHMRDLRVVGKLPQFRKAGQSQSQRMIESAGIAAARLGSRVYRDFPVVPRATGGRDPRRRVVWKSIESVPRLGVLLAVLANARAIHILRHPCGTIASVRRGHALYQVSGRNEEGGDWGIFNAAINSGLAAPYGLTKAYLKRLTPEERMAWLWVLVNEKAWLEAGDNDRYRCVRYEDVCREPLGEVRKMFDFTGLDVTPQTESFIERSTGRASDSYYSVYKKPTESAWRWRDELDAATIDRITGILRQSRIGRFYHDTFDGSGKPA